MVNQKHASQAVNLCVLDGLTVKDMHLSTFPQHFSLTKVLCWEWTGGISYQELLTKRQP